MERDRMHRAERTCGQQFGRLFSVCFAVAFVACGGSGTSSDANDVGPIDAIAMLDVAGEHPGPDVVQSIDVADSDAERDALPNETATDAPDGSGSDAADSAADSRDAADVGDARDVVDAGDAGECVGRSDDSTCSIGRCCGGVCVDVASSTANCGACRVACTSSANATSTCAAGSCTVTCNAGFGDCDGDPASGCESALNTASHCGACTTSCAEPTPVCTVAAGGAFACSSGCTAATPTRCAATMNCVDTQTDVANCGGCGLACSTSVTNATATCVAGACGFACIAGYMMCNGGCVPSASFQTDVANCGACGNACTTSVANASPTCAAGVCGIACDAGYSLCGDGCIATTSFDTDVANCGSCGNACTTSMANASPTCAAGTCGFACNSGFVSCGGACADPTSVSTCGTSCAVCTAPAHATPTCDGTSCGFACDGGYHACDASCADNTSVDSCGSACAPCTVPANATMSTCDGVTCGFVCNAGFEVDAGACAPVPPRLVYPLSTTRVTSQMPTLAWALASGTTGAHVDVCTDRGCSNVISSFDVTGSSGVPSSVLPPGVLFWRAFGRVGGTQGTTSSATWEFTVPHRSAAVSTAWGSVDDFNGDGYADLRVRDGSSLAQLFYGSSVGLGTTPGTSFTAEYTNSSDNAGDVNGDGFGDYVAVLQPASGMALMQFYEGGPSGIDATAPLVTLFPPGPGTYYQLAAGLGDVNGDGFGDVLGAYGPAAPGSFQVFFGGPGGIGTTPSQTLPVIDTFDPATVVHGDYNGDRYEDLFIGDRLNGQALVLYGSSTGLSVATPVTIPAPVPANQFPYLATEWAGDVNGDGYADVVAIDNRNNLYVFEGSVAGLHTTPDATASPQARGGYACGDFDGDGFADVVAMGASSSPTSFATFVVFVGSAGGLNTTSSVVGTSPQGAVGNGAVAFDYNGDAYDDAVLGWGTYFVGGTLPIELHLGSASGLAPMPSETVMDTLWGGDSLR